MSAIEFWYVKVHMMLNIVYGMALSLRHGIEYNTITDACLFKRHDSFVIN